MAPVQTGIEGCEVLPVSANPDARGCLSEIYRQSWPGAFKTVQWNTCASSTGVVRGVHVHFDYDEFYTLPQGRVLAGLIDIRRVSPTFRRSIQFEWSADEGKAITIPRGVAHVLYFKVDSVLVFGLSGYWTVENDVVGCQWDDPSLGFDWKDCPALRSQRDMSSGGLSQMIEHYESMLDAFAGAAE